MHAVRAVVVHVLRADPIESGRARAAALAQVQSAGQSGYTDFELVLDSVALRGDLSELLSKLAPQLTADGKETVLRAGVAVAAADGPLTTQERSVLMNAAAALGMSRARIAALIEVEERQARG